MIEWDDNSPRCRYTSSQQAISLAAFTGLMWLVTMLLTGGSVVMATMAAALALILGGVLLLWQRRISQDVEE